MSSTALVAQHARTDARRTNTDRLRRTDQWIDPVPKLRALFRERYVSSLEDYDLTRAHWRVLNLVRNNSGIGLSDLIAHAAMDIQSTMAIVGDLQNLGYIGAVAAPGDLIPHRQVATPVGQYVWQRLRQLGQHCKDALAVAEIDAKPNQLAAA